MNVYGTDMVHFIGKYWDHLLWTTSQKQRQATMVAGFMLETHPHKVIAPKCSSNQLQSLFDVRHCAVVWIFYIFLVFHVLGIMIPTDELHHFSEG